MAFASLGQAAAASGFGIVVASLAVATERRTGSEAVGTLALAVEMFARAVASLPAARRANARGRREVIAHAGCLGVLGSLVAFADFYLDSHVLYFLGLAFVGVAGAVIFDYSRKVEVRTMPPTRRIPSQAWCENFPEGSPSK